MLKTLLPPKKTSLAKLLKEYININIFKKKYIFSPHKHSNSTIFNTFKKKYNMSRTIAFYFHSGLSVLVGIPLLYMLTMMMIRAAYLGIKEALFLSSSTPDGYGGLAFFSALIAIFACSYPIVLNIWGWIVIAQGKNHPYWIFLYALLVALAITLCSIPIMILLLRSN